MLVHQDVEDVCGTTYRIIRLAEAGLHVYSIEVPSAPLSPKNHTPSSQDVAPLATPDHQGDHGQGEENGDEDEDGQRVVGRVHPDHLLHGAVGEKVLVYADDVALYQRVGPVAVDIEGLCFRAEGEEMVLTDEVCEVAPVLRIYVSHVLFEGLPADLHLPLQTGLVAGLAGSRGSGLHVEAVGG